MYPFPGGEKYFGYGGLPCRPKTRKPLGPLTFPPAWMEIFKEGTSMRRQGFFAIQKGVQVEAIGSKVRISGLHGSYGIHTKDRI